MPAQLRLSLLRSIMLFIVVICIGQEFRPWSSHMHSKAGQTLDATLYRLRTPSISITRNNG